MLLKHLKYCLKLKVQYDLYKCINQSSICHLPKKRCQEWIAQLEIWWEEIKNGCNFWKLFRLHRVVPKTSKHPHYFYKYG